MLFFETGSKSHLHVLSSSAFLQSKSFHWSQNSNLHVKFELYLFSGAHLIFLKQSATSKSYISTHLNPFSSQTKGFFRTFLKWGFVALTTNFLGTWFSLSLIHPMHFQRIKKCQVVSSTSTKLCSMKEQSWWEGGSWVVKWRGRR